MCSENIEAREISKKYVPLDEIFIRKGYFAIPKTKKHPSVKLKALRINKSGIYYTYRDVYASFDLDAVEKRHHGGCKNRPQRTAPITRPVTPSRPALNGPARRYQIKEESEVTEEKVRQPGRYRPDRRPHCQDIEEFSAKKLDDSMEKWHGPQGLPETVRHNHYFGAPGANGSAG